MNPADVAAAAPPETSIIQMFWSAHIVVKAVMLGLFLASLWCWTIIFDKTRLFRKFKNEMESFEQIFWSGQSLEELYTSLSNQSNNTAAAALFVAAMREWKRSFQQAAGFAVVTGRDGFPGASQEDHFGSVQHAESEQVVVFQTDAVHLPFEVGAVLKINQFLIF